MQRALAVNIRSSSVLPFQSAMSNITLPMELMLRATLPTRSEQLLNNLRFLPRELHPQSVNGLRSLGFDANLCADLNSFKADRNVDTPLILALFINEFFKAAGSDYAASQSIAKYLRRRARKIDVEPFGQEVAEIVKKHFKELRSAAIGPFIRDVEPYRVVQLYLLTGQNSEELRMSSSNFSEKKPAASDLKRRACCCGYCSFEVGFEMSSLFCYRY